MAESEMCEIEREFSVVVDTKMCTIDLKIQDFEQLYQHLRRKWGHMYKQLHGLFSARIEAAFASSNAMTNHTNANPAGVSAASGTGVSGGVSAFGVGVWHCSDNTNTNKIT